MKNYAVPLIIYEYLNSETELSTARIRAEIKLEQPVKC